MKKRRTPDPIIDPEAYLRAVEKIQRNEMERRVEVSFRKEHDENGKKFTAAYGWLSSLKPTNKNARRIVQHIARAKQPGKELMIIWMARSL